MLGIGERTGNCPLEAMAIEYASLKGTDDGMDFTVITDIARYFEDSLGYIIPPQTPFVGKSFNTTRAGVHADGLLKDQEIYNIFNTEKLLKKPPLVSVDAHSGLAGIAYWMNAFYALPDSHKVDKHDPIVVAVKERVDREYEDGRTTYMGDDELDQIIMALDPEMHKKLVVKSY